MPLSYEDNYGELTSPDDCRTCLGDIACPRHDADFTVTVPGHTYDTESGRWVRFAQHSSREIRTQYFNGAWYVVRKDMYPHTTHDPSNLVTHQVTRQGSCTWVGIRQGTTATAGYAVRRYEHPDTFVSGE